MKREKVTKLTDYQQGVQPVDYHKLDEQRWKKELRRAHWVAVGMVYFGTGLIVAAVALVVMMFVR